MLHHHLTVMAIANEHRLRVERANRFAHHSDPLFLEPRGERRVRSDRTSRSRVRWRRG